MKKYSLEEIRVWRKEQFDKKQPSGLKDFYIAHDVCLECRGSGKRIRFYAGTDRIDEVKNCLACNGTGEAVQP
jgi:DnaJ-class molecular chaperone